MPDTLKQLMARIGATSYCVHTVQSGPYGEVTFEDGSRLRCPAGGSEGATALNLVECLKGNMPWDEHASRAMRGAQHMRRWADYWSQDGEGVKCLQRFRKERDEYAQASGSPQAPMRDALAASFSALAHTAFNYQQEARRTVLPLRSDPRAGALRATAIWAELEDAMTNVALTAAAASLELGVTEHFFRVSKASTDDMVLGFEVHAPVHPAERRYYQTEELWDPNGAWIRQLVDAWMADPAYLGWAACRAIAGSRARSIHRRRQITH